MIVVQFDSVYYHWGLLMVRSLALHEPRRKVLTDTVNLSGKQQAELKRAHPRILVTSEAIAGNGSLRAEMARRKTMVLQRAFDTFPDEPWFGMFDADMLVRRPLTDLWSLLDGHQAALLMTDGVWEGRVYPHLFTPSGIVLVRRDGRELVDSWVKWDRHPDALHGRRPGEWFWAMHPASGPRGLAGDMRGHSLSPILQRSKLRQRSHLVGPRRLQGAQLSALSHRARSAAPNPSDAGEEVRQPSATLTFQRQTQRCGELP